MDINNPFLYDMIAISCVVISIFLSLTKGLVRETISLVEWVLAFIITYYFHPVATQMVLKYIDVPSVAQLIGMVALFIISVVILHILGKQLGAILRTNLPRNVDSIGGILFGAIRGIILPALIFNMLLLFSVSPNMQSAISHSHSYKLTRQITYFIFGKHPEQVIGHVSDSI